MLGGPSPVGEVFLHIAALSVSNDVTYVPIGVLNLLRGFVYTTFRLIRQQIRVGHPSRSSEDGEKDRAIS